jgi:hypothetical protein
MPVKKLFAALKDSLRAYFLPPEALAADELIAEDPAFAQKLDEARAIIDKDQAFLGPYLPPPVIMAGYGAGFAVWPPIAYADCLLGERADRQQRIDGGSFKDAFKKAVEHTCAEGRQLQSEDDVRRKHPSLFTTPRQP